MSFLDKQCKTKNKNVLQIYVADRQTKISPAQICPILKLSSTPFGFKDCTLLANSLVAARLRLPLTSLVLRISAVPVRAGAITTRANWPPLR
jgi:hypothetical protein